MTKQTEARELARRFGVRMCDENGDTHDEELYCLGLDDIIELKEALAQPIIENYPEKDNSQPEQDPDVYIPADALRQLKGTSLLILRSVPLYGYRGDGLTPLYTTPPQRKPCTWKQTDDIHMPDTWEADCGAVWTLMEGGPKDNDMHHCPKCGNPITEAAHGIKE